ncbi:L-lactate dehydrogenase (cytochrome), partial [Penicillium cosmopolitanum]
MATKRFSLQELAEHSREDSAFIAINGVVWDCTCFAEKHPGGAEVIESAWGKNASQPYNEVHSPGLVESFFGEEKFMGILENDGFNENGPQRAKRCLQPIQNIVNLLDMEKAAGEILTERAKVYIEDASNDGVTARLNIQCFQKVLFRPRVLRPVGSISTEVEILGKTYGLPILNAPVSLSMIAHPDAEIALAKGL